MTVVARGLRWGGRGIRGGGSRVRRRGVGILTAIRAVMVKELRGRMRGRRAFVVLTVYLVLLGLFSFGVYQLVKQNALNAATINFGQPIPMDRGEGFVGGGFPGGSGTGQVGLSATIGHALFSGLILLETLLVLVLAPAFTTGAISLEREKQTLELLVTTPLSTLGMVIGKLFSALVYVFLLILASIPFVSIVFPFGGVGPEDLVRAYVVLFALAFGMGALGLMVSAIVRRTQTATVLTFVLVLLLTLGSAGVHAFWLAGSRAPATLSANGQQLQPAKAGEAPEALLWFNAFVSAADLICTTAPTGYDPTCQYLSTVTRKPYFGPTFGQGFGECPPNARCGFEQGIQICGADECKAVPLPAGVNRGVDLPAPAPATHAPAPATEGGGGAVVAEDGSQPFPGNGGVALPPVAADVAPEQPVQVATFGYPRDTFWPSSTLAFLVAGILLTILSAQLVAPTRRLRLPRIQLRRRQVAFGAGVGAAERVEPIAIDGVSAKSNDQPTTESPA
ncbi:MAG: ABC transporter permease subunit [Chloroflexi bacterium]|nr:ABC transporter permease subunit [Chloroflexota bacterium]